MRTLQVFGAGVLVYVVAAACGAAEQATMTRDAGAGEVADAIGDAVSNPVREASAAGPSSATEKCSKTIPSGGFYAEHAYPGAKQVELANVTALVPSVVVDGYSMQSTTVLVKDGWAAVPCVSGTDVVFVRP